MKTQETNATTLDSILTDLQSKNPKGAINLNELEKKLGLGRLEVVAQIKSGKWGRFFKVGRKGRESMVDFTFVKGQYTPNPGPKAVKQDKSGGLVLRINIAGVQRELPINFEIAA